MQTLQKTVQIGNVEYIMKMHIKDDGFDVEMMNVITKDKYMVCHNAEYIQNIFEGSSYSTQFTMDSFKQMLVESMEGHHLFKTDFAIDEDKGKIYIIFYVNYKTTLGKLPATCKWIQFCGSCLEYVPPPVGDKLAEKIVSIETRIDQLEIMIKKIGDTVNDYLDNTNRKQKVLDLSDSEMTALDDNLLEEWVQNASCEQVGKILAKYNTLLARAKDEREYDMYRDARQVVDNCYHRFHCTK
jgi:hypothetical protein